MEKKSILRRLIIFETEVEQVEELYGNNGQLFSDMENKHTRSHIQKAGKFGNWEKFALGKK